MLESLLCVVIRPNNVSTFVLVFNMMYGNVHVLVAKK